MRYQPEHKERTRAAILAEACRQLRGHGTQGVSLGSVMKGVGLTHGGFYAHFSSREDMLAAAIEQTFQDSRDRWAHETLDRSPKDGLAAYIDWYLSKAHRDDRQTGCVIAAIGSEELPPACQHVLAEGVRRLVTLIATAIGDEELARSALAEMVGALVLARIERDSRRSDALLAEARIRIKKRLKLG